MIETICTISIGVIVFAILFSVYRNMNLFVSVMTEMNEARGTFITVYDEIYDEIKDSNEVIVDGLDDIHITGGTDNDKRLLLLKRDETDNKNRHYLLVLRELKDSKKYELHRIYLNGKTISGMTIYSKEKGNLVCNDISDLQITKVKEHLLKIIMNGSHMSYELFIGY